MKKILVIEDDVATLELMEILLQSNGYAVIKANREVTIEEIISIKPDLAIFDFLLPHRLGSEICLEIKNHPLAKHIPVILYSASGHLSKVAMDSRADAFLSKPFDVQELLDLVKKVIL